MTNANVLVVDDDDPIRRLLIEYLRSASLANVKGARDGIEALHEVSQSAYAVVLLDLMMPKMSGMDFLDSLAARTSDPSVEGLGKPPAVLVITSAAQQDVPNDAIQHRSRLVRGVFRKPLDLAELAASVERFVWRSTGQR